MDKEEFLKNLDLLGVNQTEIAEYLGVDSRTVRKWIKKDHVPLMSAQAIWAWVKLNTNHYAWKPNSVDFNRFPHGFKKPVVSQFEN